MIYIPVFKERGYLKSRHNLRQLDVVKALVIAKGDNHWVLRDYDGFAPGDFLRCIVEAVDRHKAKIRPIGSNVKGKITGRKRYEIGEVVIARCIGATHEEYHFLDIETNEDSPAFKTSVLPSLVDLERKNQN